MYSWIVHFLLPLIFRFIIVITRETEQLEKLGVVIGTALAFDDCQEEAVKLLLFSIPPCEEEFLAKIRLLRKHAKEPYNFLKRLHAAALLDGMLITDCSITTHIIRIKAWRRTLHPSSRKRGTREGPYDIQDVE